MWCWKKKAATLVLVAAILAIFILLSPSAFADTVVSPDGWGWQNPLPQGNPLDSVWGSSPSDVFAVGDEGTILHYDGSTWSAMTSGTTNYLNGIWGASNSDVFAVGTDATILHYDGVNWSLMSGISPYSPHFSAVWGTSSSDVFAVGNIGAIFHYDGSAWTKMTSGTTNHLDSVWGTSSFDVFAVGTFGTILHYNGSAWSPMSSGTNYSLLDVWGSSASDVFAVGGDTILHYNGSNWSSMSGGSGRNLNGIWGSSASNVWAVGGTSIHYDGVAWSKVDDTALEGGRAVWGTSSSDVFKVSIGIEHFDGSSWSLMTSHITVDYLYSVWSNSPSYAFAVSSEGNILHHEGTTWTVMNSGTTQMLNSVWGSSASDVFAVGNYGTIVHYNGSTWSPMSSGTTNILTGVWGTSSNDIFAVGSNGRILHYNGGTWSPMSSNTSNHLLDVWGSSSYDVFAVGSSGTILHYNGSTWSPMTSGISNTIDGVWGTSPINVFAVAMEGTILHYNGISWSSMTSSTTRDLYGVWGSSPSDVFVVGGYGTILHYNGSIWSQMSSGTTNSLDCVCGSSPSDVFAVGGSGTILHYPEGAPAPSVGSLSPNQGIQGQSLSVTIAGTYLTGATSVSFGSGITVNSFTVNSSTQITANITISGSATTGARDVSVTTPGGIATKTGGFTVNAAPPTISTVSPNSGIQGQTLSVTITGTYLTDTSSVSFGSGITVNSFTVDSSTQITGNITISGSATTGARDVSVTTPGGIATKTGGFTVNAAPPTISTVSPNSGIQGQTLSVTITGTYLTDASSVSFGSGITVNSFTVDSSTQITGNITISGSATTGARDVSVTTPGGIATKTGGFTVYALSQADFSADRTGVVVGQSVQFTNSSTGGVTPLTYQWDFNNDGSWDSTAQNPSHAYSATGTYTVVLKVTDSATNTDTETKTSYITVSNAPQADFSANRTAVVVGQSIQFTNSSSGGVTPLTYQWDFNNDGSWDSTAQNPSYAYSATGTYTVVLKVTDSATNTNTRTRAGYITVSNAPQADFSANRTAVVVGQSVQFTNLSTGGVTPLTYQWDFNNDGSWDSTAQNPSHAYSATGTYTVVLKVTDSATNTDTETKTSYITVSNAPQADFSANRTAVVVGQSVQFTNLSTGGVTPLTYQWDFNNDGSWDSTAQNPSYAYSITGTYTVVLKVTDSATNTNTRTRTGYITVSNAPQADFSADRTGVVVGQSVQFTNSSTGGVTPLTYQWDFNNDGSWDSTAQNPSHAYSATGTYTVVLKVTDSATNTDTETKTSYITVSNAPQADFSANRTAVVVGQSIQFTNSSSGGVTPLTYQWDFNNDGSWDSTAQNPSYAYSATGTYTVVLKVTDSATNTNTRTRAGYITVSNAPQADFTADRTAVVVGQSVQFTNLSTGGVTPLTYQWDFNNDGSWDSTAQNPSHAYSATGTYTVVLKVTDSATNTDTETKTSYITVSNAPQADFSANRTAVVVGQSVQFTNLSTGGVTPLTYQWDFNNDGSWDSTAQNPSYAYSITGTYTVVLKVTDSATNTNTRTRTGYIAVSNVPQADFTADRTAVVVGQSVQFTNSSSGGVTPLTYQWDFNNDGSWDSTAQNPTYAYSATGTYTVVLKVTDSATNTDTETKLDYITVTQPTDITSPAVVSDLAISSVLATSVTLSWTAPGDDSNVGTAFQYDIRYSTSFITDSNWDLTTQCIGEPSPQIAGTTQNHNVIGLSPGTGYYFAMKTADEVPYWSGLSNIAIGTTYNTPEGSPTVNLPGAIVIFSDVGSEGMTSVNWSTDNPAGPTPPNFYVHGLFMNISTTATYTDTVRVCMSYDESGVANENNLRLFHWDGAIWEDVTTLPVDTVNNIICGNVTTLSPFFVGEPAYQVSTATGTGTARFSVSSGTIENLTAVSESSLPAEGKPSLVFPHGFFSFDITGLSNGETVTVVMELPSNIPTNSQYWKWDSTLGWHQIDFSDNDGDRIIAIQLTDNGTGDSDPTLGRIHDDGGPGNPSGGGGGAAGVPAFPNIYIGIAAAFGAGFLAFFLRRRLLHQG